MPDDLFSITDVAHAFGLSVPALRYYEERGLIEASERRGRVRYYSRDDLGRLAYIQLWHEDGCSRSPIPRRSSTRHGGGPQQVDRGPGRPDA